MRRLILRTTGVLAIGGAIGAGAALVAQTAIKPGHERVPPYREPSPYMNGRYAPATSASDGPRLVPLRQTASN